MSNRGSSLATGGLLATNDYLCSADGSHFAILQSDGNLVIYHGNGPTNQGAFVWNSGVAPGGDPHFFAIMQKEGNLVVYRGDPLHQGAFVWNSGPAPAAGQYVATLQNDGNLVITAEGTQPPTLVWSAQPLILAKKSPTLTMGSYLATNDHLSSANGSYFAIMQKEGNLVIYHGSAPVNQGAYVWDSGVVPGGDPHFFVVMQNDGNLVVYRGSSPTNRGAFVWNSGVAPGAFEAFQYVATLQNDGNLVITVGSQRPMVVWSAKPLPSIALTITNQMSWPLTASIDSPLPGVTSPALALDPGQSGSLPLPLNTTTTVEYDYAHTFADPTDGVMVEELRTQRSYTVATEDTTLTVIMIVAGGSNGMAISNPTIGAYPTFTETLPKGVTAS